MKPSTLVAMRAEAGDPPEYLRTGDISEKRFG